MSLPDKNYIFGLTGGLLKKSQSTEAGIVIDDAGNGIRTGTPCLLLQGKEVMIRPGIMGTKADYALFVTPTHGGGRPRSVYTVNHGKGAPVVKAMGPSTFLNNAISKELTSLDVGKLPEVLEYVGNKGPVSLLLGKCDNKKLKDDVFRMMEELLSRFEYTSLLYTSEYRRRSIPSDDMAIFTLTFIDIKHSMPIFDTSKMDGVILQMSLTYSKSTEKGDKLYPAFELSLALSNHRENVTTINGQQTYFTMHPKERVIDWLNANSNAFLAVGKVQERDRKEKKRGGRKGRPAVAAAPPRPEPKDAIFDVFGEAPEPELGYAAPEMADVAYDPEVVAGPRLSKKKKKKTSGVVFKAVDADF